MIVLDLVLPCKAPVCPVYLSVEHQLVEGPNTMNVLLEEMFDECFSIMLLLEILELFFRGFS